MASVTAGHVPGLPRDRMAEKPRIRSGAQYPQNAKGAA